METNKTTDAKISLVELVKALNPKIAKPAYTGMAAWKTDDNLGIVSIPIRVPRRMASSIRQVIADNMDTLLVTIETIIVPLCVDSAYPAGTTRVTLSDLKSAKAAIEGEVVGMKTSLAYLKGDALKTVSEIISGKEKEIETLNTAIIAEETRLAANKAKRNASKLLAGNKANALMQDTDDDGNDDDGNDDDGNDDDGNDDDGNDGKEPTFE